ncbi:hypothetical protein BDP27DRAFT_1320004 [Rhodocollybia butyracea]|uniref:Uncharacterized protein n=1 Tax=Rhodocollybia butyracea TaxID=206335 RepID=A0A9P5UA86_9AGAR|nr:hypothetical protein BDP27DRAFT_1320004 [Rhodocollybia butyracea]
MQMPKSVPKIFSPVVRTQPLVTEYAHVAKHFLGAPMPRGIDKISEKLIDLPPEEIAPYVAERKALKDQIKEKRQVDEERIKKETENWKARKAQIYQKLLEEGWTETTIPKDWECEAQVTYATKLTKAGWTKIEGPLQMVLRWTIQRHRQNERSASVRQAYQLLLQDKPLFPSWSTFSQFPTIKALLDVPQFDRPEHESFVLFDQAKWDAALLDTEPHVAAYEDRMRELAMQRLSEAYNTQNLPIPKDIISAPRSYFEYFQGEPLEIHAIMRDRRSFCFHKVTPGEFEIVQPPSCPGTFSEWLKVHLKALDSTGN